MKKGLERLVAAHNETSCCVSMKFNYHRHHRGSRRRARTCSLGLSPHPWAYEFIGDYHMEAAFRKSAGRSYNVLKRLCKLSGIYL